MGRVFSALGILVVVENSSHEPPDVMTVYMIQSCWVFFISISWFAPLEMLLVRVVLLLWWLLV